MTERKISRRHVLAGGAAAAGLLAAPAKVLSQAPAASAVTPALIEAAKKEGRVVWYAAMDLPVSQNVAKRFEAKYPGISVRIERTGSERQFQRLAQEYGSKIYAADIINASDAAHFVAWKRNGWLAPYVPEDVAKFFPANTAMPTASLPRRASTWSRSPTTPPWSSRRTRPRASWTCCIRNG